MSKLKSKIDFKPTTKDAYDSQPISRITYDETGQWEEPKKDFAKEALKKFFPKAKWCSLDELKFAKPKKKKNGI